MPLGPWGKDVFGWFTYHFDWIFRGVAWALGVVLDTLVYWLLAVPPVILIIVFALIAYALQRSWKLALGALLGFALMLNQGLWKDTIQTLVLSALRPLSPWPSASRSASGRRIAHASGG